MSYGDAPGMVGRRANGAQVKWYNPEKGFGFISLGDGSPDAFLHATALDRSGFAPPQPGAEIDCEVTDGQRGPQVAVIYDVRPPAEGAVMPERSGFRNGVGGGGGGGGPRGDSGPAIDGTVKFFNAAKGFGFIRPDDGGPDVFVSGRVLERAGLAGLESDQRVRFKTRAGMKGPQATFIELP